MMGIKAKAKGFEMSPKKLDGRREGGSDWELRPGGMLVQKRSPDSDRDSAVPPAPTVRVRVKYGAEYHEIYINSRATFGELKKKLEAVTGLHPQDQKLFFKDKERDSKAYLDVVGVKERSKIVLVEDPISQERRFIEMRKTAKMEKAIKSISEISSEVDKLASKVSDVESVISKGGKVAEIEVLNLIELLMNQLIKLDGIMVDGDVKMQRKMQVRRVQKYVETLDLLKIQNSKQNANQNGVQPIPVQNGVHSVRRNPTATQRQLPPLPEQRHQQQSPQPQPQRQRPSTEGGVVVTTKWETFDPSPPLIPLTSASTATPTLGNKLHWELFE